MQAAVESGSSPVSVGIAAEDEKDFKEPVVIRAG